MLPTEGLTQIIKKETRHCSNTKASLIDHIWLKNLSKLVQTKNIETSSDHDLIVSIHKINGTVGTNSATRSRDYKNFNKEEYLMELFAQKWTDIYNLEDTTVIASKITENICVPLNKMAPVKLRNVKSNIKNKGKLSIETKKLMADRDLLKIRIQIIIYFGWSGKD